MTGESTAKPHAGVRFPPPFMYLISIAVGVGAEFLYPLTLLPGTPGRVVGGALIVASVGLILWAVRSFKREKTAVEPWKPTSTIIVRGPFRFTRNPIYISLSGIQAGIAFAANSPWILIALVPVLVIVNFAVIGREERYLERTFGETYLAYKGSVRRWV